jgi:hypothetical protein
MLTGAHRYPKPSKYLAIVINAQCTTSLEKTASRTGALLQDKEGPVQAVSLGSADSPAVEAVEALSHSPQAPAVSVLQVELDLLLPTPTKYSSK